MRIIAQRVQPAALVAWVALWLGGVLFAVPLSLALSDGQRWVTKHIFQVHLALVLQVRRKPSDDLAQSCSLRSQLDGGVHV